MLRVGIIGAGAIANLNVQGYMHSPDSELVAICDVNLNNAKEKAERWGLRTLKIYKNYICTRKKWKRRNLEKP